MDSEAAVRTYLTLLEDPTKLVDAREVQRLEAAAKKATDPIEKLKAVTALDHAKNVDTAWFEAQFVKHAKRWAADHGIPASSFQQLGVSEGTLRSAGLLKPQTKATGAGRSRRTTRAPQRGSNNRGPVTAEEIKAGMLQLPSPFTLIDVATTIGGSPMTIRKAVTELVADGTLDRLGVDPAHNGRGRAPILYANKAKRAKH